MPKPYLQKLYGNIRKTNSLDSLRLLNLKTLLSNSLNTSNRQVKKAKASFILNYIVYSWHYELLISIAYKAIDNALFRLNWLLIHLYLHILTWISTTTKCVLTIYSTLNRTWECEFAKKVFPWWFYYIKFWCFFCCAFLVTSQTSWCIDLWQAQRWRDRLECITSFFHE